jgi:N-acetylmuramoyl-L-alanine amidase
MKKIGLIVGHDPHAQGASNELITEFDFNNSLAPLIAKHLIVLGDYNPLVIYRSDGLSVLPKQVNELNLDLAISLHCNAFNKSVSGSEVLYAASSTNGARFASIMQKRIVSTLKNRDRGIKPIARNERGGVILNATKPVTILIEPFFIDNMKEYQYVESIKDELAKAIALGVHEYYGK